MRKRRAVLSTGQYSAFVEALTYPCLKSYHGTEIIDVSHSTTRDTVIDPVSVSMSNLTSLSKCSTSNRDAERGKKL